jgi:hypothetical protein
VRQKQSPIKEDEFSDNPIQKNMTDVTYTTGGQKTDELQKQTKYN